MKKILFSISSLFIGIGIVVISLELFLRLNPRLGYNYAVFQFKRKDSSMSQNFNTRFKGMYRAAPLLGFEHVPDSCGINSLGLIGKEYRRAKDKNVFRILLIGDSLAFGMQYFQGSSFLEDELNNNPVLHSKYRFEIWNAGVGGYDVHQYALYLEYKGLNYNPDMVMVFLCLNDFQTNTNIYYKDKEGFTEYYFPLKGISKRYTVNPFLLKHSYLYRFAILRLDSYFFSERKKQEVPLEEENGKYYMARIKTLCDKKAIPLFAVVFPYLKSFSEYGDYDIFQYHIMLKVIKGLQLNYLNLCDYLFDKDLQNLRQDKEDYTHPSKEGYDVIGKIIYDYMLAKFFKDI